MRSPAKGGTQLNDWLRCCLLAPPARPPARRARARNQVAAPSALDAVGGVKKRWRLEQRVFARVPLVPVARVSGAVVDLGLALRGGCWLRRGEHVRGEVCNGADARVVFRAARDGVGGVYRGRGALAGGPKVRWIQVFLKLRWRRVFRAIQRWAVFFANTQQVVRCVARNSTLRQVSVRYINNFVAGRSLMQRVNFTGVRCAAAVVAVAVGYSDAMLDCSRAWVQT